MRSLSPARWPLSVKVPVLVAFLMVLVSAGVSKAVLWRLDATQEAHFQEVADAFLEGLATALQPHVIRRDSWEAYDVVERAIARYGAVRAELLVVSLADGSVLAASAPLEHPIGAPAPPEGLAAPVRPALGDASETVWIRRDLSEAGIALGAIMARVDVARFRAEQAAAFWALLGFNAVLTALLAILGFLLARRVVQPLARVANLLGEASGGRLTPIPTTQLPPPDTEAGRAYRSYNAAAVAIDEREALLARLAAEERAATIGRYASAMAHEVNNPLGGLFNAVRMIQRHGDDADRRERAARLIERGLESIRDVVRASLVLWREGDEAAAALTREDIEDLRQLVTSEAERRSLVLDWENDVSDPVAIDARRIRQIALNLLINACAASPPGGRVHLSVSHGAGALALAVSDEGPGMPHDCRATLVGGGVSPAPAARGLGLWTVARLVSELGGTIDVDAGPDGRGATIVVRVSLAAEEARDAA
ncbi:MAG: HAMP domain-containing histidine kinase [Microvirga sp.]|nr:HAMP domain-containing histidine kinase [Microvirga sp.]